MGFSLNPVITTIGEESEGEDYSPKKGEPGEGFSQYNMNSTQGRNDRHNILEKVPEMTRGSAFHGPGDIGYSNGR